MGRKSNLLLVGCGGADVAEGGPLTATEFASAYSLYNNYSANTSITTHSGISITDGLISVVLFNEEDISTAITGVDIFDGVTTFNTTKNTSASSTNYAVFEYAWTGGADTVDLIVTKTASSLAYIHLAGFTISDSSASETDFVYQNRQYIGTGNDLDASLAIASTGVAVGLWYRLSAGDDALTLTDCDNLSETSANSGTQGIVSSKSTLTGAAPSDSTISAQRTSGDGNLGAVFISYE